MPSKTGHTPDTGLLEETDSDPAAPADNIVYLEQHRRKPPKAEIPIWNLPYHAPVPIWQRLFSLLQIMTRGLVIFISSPIKMIHAWLSKSSGKRQDRS